MKQNSYYQVTANHQSRADILIVQHLLNRRIPLMKFFLKQELVWTLVIGLCWWALDFPFMQRYSREYIKKHPEKLGKDLETTRKACEKFRTVPVSIVNYLEGFRFTSTKHQKQQSPFIHLLKPRAGGISYVVDAMGDLVKTLLNVTIAYHHQRIGFWERDGLPHWQTPVRLPATDAFPLTPRVLLVLRETENVGYDAKHGIISPGACRTYYSPTAKKLDLAIFYAAYR